MNVEKNGKFSTSGTVQELVPVPSLCARTADLDPLLSPVLVLLNHLPSQSDGVQVGEERLLLLLLTASSLNLGLGQRVDHGHVDVQVVGLLETFPTKQASKFQVSLCLVFGHVVFK